MLLHVVRQCLHDILCKPTKDTYIHRRTEEGGDGDGPIQLQNLNMQELCKRAKLTALTFFNERALEL